MLYDFFPVHTIILHVFLHLKFQLVLKRYENIEITLFDLFSTFCTPIRGWIKYFFLFEKIINWIYKFFKKESFELLKCGYREQ